MGLYTLWGQYPKQSPGGAIVPVYSMAPSTHESLLEPSMLGSSEDKHLKMEKVSHMRHGRRRGMQAKPYLPTCLFSTTKTRSILVLLKVLHP